MNLVSITYEGKKPYKDRIVRYSWEPGDAKLVPQAAAKKLLRFAEFKEAAGKGDAKGKGAPTQSSAQQQAQIAAELDAQKKQDEDDASEGILLTIESMDKKALIEYAKKYETDIDSKLKVADVRSQVALLIEQFGAR